MSKKTKNHTQAQSERSMHHEKLNQEWKTVMASTHKKMSAGSEDISKSTRTHGWNNFKESKKR